MFKIHAIFRAVRPAIRQPLPLIVRQRNVPWWRGSAAVVGMSLSGHLRSLPGPAPVHHRGVRAPPAHRVSSRCPRSPAHRPGCPVVPARRSAAAQAKASGQHDPAGQPCRSFRALLDHLATLTRNQVRFAGTRATVPMLTEPTSTQRQAFDLLGVPIPLTLK